MNTPDEFLEDPRRDPPTAMDCPLCDKGKVDDGSECDTCEGSGQVTLQHYREIVQELADADREYNAEEANGCD